MKDTIEVKGSERDVVRVFAIDLPPGEVESFATRDADGRWPLKDALNAEALDPERVEVFPIADLGELGLSGYLSQGMGVSDDDLAPQRDRLDALDGHVAVIGSSAFRGTAQTLHPEPPLRLVASFREEEPEPAGAPMRPASADGEAPPASGMAPPSGPSQRLSRGTVSMIVAGALVLAAILFWALG